MYTKKLTKNYMSRYLLTIAMCLQIFSTYTSMQPALFSQSDFINKLCQMIMDTSDALKNNQVVHWWIGGTLLGAVRHKGPIPWDIDADLCIKGEQVDDLYKVNISLQKKGYLIAKRCELKKIHFIILSKNDLIKFGKIKDTDTLYPIFDISENEDTIFNENHFPHVDICLAYIGANDEVHHAQEPEYYFLVNELFPLKKYPFGEMQDLMGPNNPFPYLERAYGKNYMTHDQHGKPLSEILSIG